jgi:hypothetical protein
MHFNHYGGASALLAADLVNLPRPFSPSVLEPVLAERDVVERRLSPEQTAAVADWSDRLGHGFGPQELEDRIRVINALLSDAACRPYITSHDDHRPHLHYSAPDGDPVDHLRARTAAGLAYVMCYAEPNRLGRCARAQCGRAFVDTSRNGLRAYCCLRCANNEAVSRHRSRR